MNKRMMVVAAALVLTAAVPASAQIRDAGSKIRGDAYREGSAQSYSRAAYGHAEALNDYSRSYSYIPTDTAKEHTEEVKRNVTAAKKELTKLGPAAKNDKTVAKHVDTLNAHYDKVLEHCKTMEGECAKDDKADSAKVGDCCKSMTDSLKSADAEQKKLGEHLKSTDKK